jgi:hypothetical protein
VSDWGFGSPAAIPFAGAIFCSSLESFDFVLGVGVIFFWGASYVADGCNAVSIAPFVIVV